MFLLILHSQFQIYHTKWFFFHSLAPKVLHIVVYFNPIWFEAIYSKHLMHLWYFFFFFQIKSRFYSCLFYNFLWNHSFDTHTHTHIRTQNGKNSWNAIKSTLNKVVSSVFLLAWFQANVMNEIYGTFKPKHVLLTRVRKNKKKIKEMPTNKIVHILSIE